MAVKSTLASGIGARQRSTVSLRNLMLPSGRCTQSCGKGMGITCSHGLPRAMPLSLQLAPVPRADNAVKARKEGACPAPAKPTPHYPARQVVRCTRLARHRCRRRACSLGLATPGAMSDGHLGSASAYVPQDQSSSHWSSCRPVLHTPHSKSAVRCQVH